MISLRGGARLVAAAIAIGSITTPVFTADAALVEASALTSVTVDAPLYDANLGAQNGCDPVGCVGSFTR